MSVTVDNTGHSNGSAAGVSTLSLASFVIGSLTKGLLFIGVSFWSATDRTIDLVNSKWNSSQTFTQHDTTSVSEAGGTRRAIILYRKSPTAATASVTIVLSGTVDELVIGATSWDGVDQTTPLGIAVKDGVANADTASTTCAVTGSAVGNIVHDVISVDDFSAAANTSSNTKRWDQAAASNTSDGAGATAAGSASTVNMTWTPAFHTHGPYSYAHIAVDIKADSGGAVTDNLDWSPKPQKFVENPTLGTFDRLAMAGSFAYDKKRKFFIPKHVAEGSILEKVA